MSKERRRRRRREGVVDRGKETKKEGKNRLEREEDEEGRREA